jgi:hypothetical protein
VAVTLVGRQDALAALERARAAAPAGEGRFVLVAGEPGMGKTTLLETLGPAARAGGAKLLWATGWEGLGAPAFWPWIQILRAAGLDLPEAEHDAGAEEVRFRLFDAVTTRLREVSVSSPLVIVLDDLHWADAGSLRLLGFAAGELRRAPVLLAGSYRDVEVEGTETGALLAGMGAERIRLTGLDRQAVGELLAATTGAAAPAELVKAVADRSGGNPLFVQELARLMAAQGPGAGGAGGVPDGIKPVLARRLARLSQPCQELLTTAAVIGDRFGVDVLARSTGSEPAVALGLLDEAVRARLVVEEGLGRYAFGHTLVRDTLSGGLPLDGRVALHYRVGESLEALGGEDRLSQLANHFLEAAPGGDTIRAVDYAERAGRRALNLLAYEEACVLFARALDALGLAVPDPSRRLEIALALGDARAGAGDQAGARAAFAEAAGLAREVGDAEGLARAALGPAGSAGFEVPLFDQAQIELLEAALAALPAGDSRLRASLLGRLSVALTYVDSPARRSNLAEESVAMARRLGDPKTLAYALAAHCDAISDPDHCVERRAAATEIIDLAGGDRALELLGRRLRLVAALEFGDVAAVDAEIEAFARVADALRQGIYRWYAPLWRAMRALMDGRPAEAERLGAEAMAIGEAAGSENAFLLGNVFRGVLAMERFDWKSAAAVVLALAPIPEASPPGSITNPAALFVPEIEPEATRRELDRLAAGGLGAVPFDSEWLPNLCQVARACFVSRHTTLAAIAYDSLKPYGDLFAVEGIGAGCYGSVSRHLGLLAIALGRPDEAAVHFDAALTANRRVGATLPVAATLRAYGALFASSSYPAEQARAAAMAEEAAALYADMGITPPEARPSAPPASTMTAGANTFVREGDMWVLTYEGSTARLSHRKGLGDLAQLLARPDQEVHVLDLVAVAEGHEGSRRRQGGGGDAGPLIDERARREYQRRLTELDEDIAAAKAANDLEHAARIEAERDALIDQLTAAYGLGGRARKAGDPAERARAAVTVRLRDALTRIEAAHPGLGRHLRAAVRTGMWCVYAPERPTSWRLTP